MASERAVLWLAALAVFGIVNPVAGLDGRTWQEAVLLWGGCAAVVIACAGVSALSAFLLYVLGAVAVHHAPGGPYYVLLLVAWAGVFALAVRQGGAQIVRVIVAANVAVAALQWVWAWESLLHLAVPSSSVTVYNVNRTITGLTSSSGDLACVLAMGLPFCFVGAFWIGKRPLEAMVWAVTFLAGSIALLGTQAISGIAAGAVGMAVIAWPWFAQRVLGDWRIGVGALGLLAGGIALERGELLAAATDERWRVWGAALTRWAGSDLASGSQSFSHLLSRWVFGSGLGSWAAGNFAVIDPWKGEARLWDRLHFDALQAGYELGVVGLVLAALAFAALVRAARHNGRADALAALCALAVCQFGHFPFHLAAPMVVAALVAGEALHGKA